MCCCQTDQNDRPIGLWIAQTTNGEVEKERTEWEESFSTRVETNETKHNHVRVTIHEHVK